MTRTRGEDKTNTFLKKYGILSPDSNVDDEKAKLKIEEEVETVITEVNETSLLASPRRKARKKTKAFSHSYTKEWLEKFYNDLHGFASELEQGDCVHDPAIQTCVDKSHVLHSRERYDDLCHEKKLPIDGSLNQSGDTVLPKNNIKIIRHERKRDEERVQKDPKTTEDQRVHFQNNGKSGEDSCLGCINENKCSANRMFYTTHGAIRNTNGNDVITCFPLSTTKPGNNQTMEMHLDKTDGNVNMDEPTKGPRCKTVCSNKCLQNAKPQKATSATKSKQSKSSKKSVAKTASKFNVEEFPKPTKSLKRVVRSNASSNDIKGAHSSDDDAVLHCIARSLMTPPIQALIRRDVEKCMKEAVQKAKASLEKESSKIRKYIDASGIRNKERVNSDVKNKNSSLKRKPENGSNDNTSEEIRRESRKSLHEAQVLCNQMKETFSRNEIFIGLAHSIATNCASSEILETKKRFSQQFANDLVTEMGVEPINQASGKDSSLQATNKELANSTDFEKTSAGSFFKTCVFNGELAVDTQAEQTKIENSPDREHLLRNEGDSSSERRALDQMISCCSPTSKNTDQINNSSLSPNEIRFSDQGAVAGDDLGVTQKQLLALNNLAETITPGETRTLVKAVLAILERRLITVRQAKHAAQNVQPKDWVPNRDMVAINEATQVPTSPKKGINPSERARCSYKLHADPIKDSPTKRTQSPDYSQCELIEGPNFAPYVNGDHFHEKNRHYNGNVRAYAELMREKARMKKASIEKDSMDFQGQRACVNTVDCEQSHRADDGDGRPVITMTMPVDSRYAQHSSPICSPNNADIYSITEKINETSFNRRRSSSVCPKPPEMLKNQVNRSSVAYNIISHQNSAEVSPCENIRTHPIHFNDNDQVQLKQKNPQRSPFMQSELTMTTCKENDKQSKNQNHGNPVEDFSQMWTYLESHRPTNPSVSERTEPYAQIRERKEQFQQNDAPTFAAKSKGSSLHQKFISIPKSHTNNVCDDRPKMTPCPHESSYKHPHTASKLIIPPFYMTSEREGIDKAQNEATKSVNENFQRKFQTLEKDLELQLSPTHKKEIAIDEERFSKQIPNLHRVDNGYRNSVVVIRSPQDSEKRREISPAKQKTDDNLHPCQISDIIPSKRLAATEREHGRFDNVVTKEYQSQKLICGNPKDQNCNLGVVQFPGGPSGKRLQCYFNINDAREKLCNERRWNSQNQKEQQELQYDTAILKRFPDGEMDPEDFSCEETVLTGTSLTKRFHDLNLSQVDTSVENLNKELASRGNDRAAHSDVLSLDMTKMKNTTKSFPLTATKKRQISFSQPKSPMTYLSRKMNYPLRKAAPQEKDSRNFSSNMGCYVQGGKPAETTCLTTANSKCKNGVPSSQKKCNEPKYLNATEQNRIDPKAGMKKSFLHKHCRVESTNKMNMNEADVAIRLLENFTPIRSADIKTKYRLRETADDTTDQECENKLKQKEKFRMNARKNTNTENQKSLGSSDADNSPSFFESSVFEFIQSRAQHQRDAAFRDLQSCARARDDYCPATSAKDDTDNFIQRAWVNLESPKPQNNNSLNKSAEFDDKNIEFPPGTLVIKSYSQNSSVPVNVQAQITRSASITTPVDVNGTTDASGIAELYKSKSSDHVLTESSSYTKSLT